MSNETTQWGEALIIEAHTCPSINKMDIENMA